MPTVIEIDRLTKEYEAGFLRKRKTRALDTLSLKVEKGQIFGFLGANGAGKTTTDRKSTRLNSSHDQISYAVFCLKKKKKQRNRRLFSIRTGEDRRRRHPPVYAAHYVLIAVFLIDCERRIYA